MSQTLKNCGAVIFGLTMATLMCAGSNAQSLQPQLHSIEQSASAVEQQNTGDPTVHRADVASGTGLRKWGTNIIGSDAAAQAPYKISGRFHLQAGTTQGYLVLECQLQPGNYIYSLTQTEPIKPTQIRVTSSEHYAIRGAFHPDQPPKIIESDPVFEQRVEKHSGTVRFFVTFEIAPGIDVTQLKPEMLIDGQICSDEGFCIPINAQTVSAEFAGYFERTSQKE